MARIVVDLCELNQDERRVLFNIVSNSADRVLNRKRKRSDYDDELPETSNLEGVAQSLTDLSQTSFISTNADRHSATSAHLASPPISAIPQRHVADTNTIVSHSTANSFSNTPHPSTALDVASRYKTPKRFLKDLHLLIGANKMVHCDCGLPILLKWKLDQTAWYATCGYRAINSKARDSDVCGVFSIIQFSKLDKHFEWKPLEPGHDVRRV